MSKISRRSVIRYGAANLAAATLGRGRLWGDDRSDVALSKTFSIPLVDLSQDTDRHVIVAAGTCTEWVQRYMNWNEQSKGAIILRKLCGVLVLIGGLYLLFIAP